jgi:hypothetical protein
MILHTDGFKGNFHRPTAKLLKGNALLVGACPNAPDIRSVAHEMAPTCATDKRFRPPGVKCDRWFQSDRTSIAQDHGRQTNPEPCLQGYEARNCRDCRVGEANAVTSRNQHGTCNLPCTLIQQQSTCARLFLLRRRSEPLALRARARCVTARPTDKAADYSGMPIGCAIGKFYLRILYEPTLLL